MGKLTGKIAIVTGGGGGLGLETATVLAGHGAKVAIAELDGAKGEEAAKAICKEGGEAIAFATDVSDEAQVKAMTQHVADVLGGIDILHNNAAFQTPDQRSRDRDVCNVESEAWDKAMAVNAKGSLLCAKHAIPHMLKRGGGSIINTSSGFGWQGDLTLTSYAMSKAAVTILSKSIATQYGKQNIRANTIQIGLVLGDTAQHAIQGELRELILDAHLTPALGHPRNIADLVAFLASDESAFITGATIPIDGGFSAHAPSVAALRKYFEKLGRNNF